MISPTPTMENTTEVEYISIYDRKRGRPRKYNTLEEKLEAKREIARQHYKAHYLEYRDVKNQKRREKRSMDKQNRIEQVTV
jgi:hypothetical protein